MTLNCSAQKKITKSGELIKFGKNGDYIYFKLYCADPNGALVNIRHSDPGEFFRNGTMNGLDRKPK